MTIENFMINVAELRFERATPRSAVKRTIDCAIEPG